MLGCAVACILVLRTDIGLAATPLMTPLILDHRMALLTLMSPSFDFVHPWTSATWYIPSLKRKRMLEIWSYIAGFKILKRLKRYLQELLSDHTRRSGRTKCISIYLIIFHCESSSTKILTHKMCAEIFCFVSGSNNDWPSLFDVLMIYYYLYYTYIYWKNDFWMSISSCFYRASRAGYYYQKFVFFYHLIFFKF